MIEEKIEKLQSRNDYLKQQLTRPDILSNPQIFKQLAREQNDLNHILDHYSRLQKVILQIDDDKNIIETSEDEELISIAKDEIPELEAQVIKLEDELKHLLIPKDLNDTKNAIIEIRAGTGGDEAGLFVGDLFRIGFKEIIFSVSGNNAYGNLKFESGVHRVQRVPETETQGRIHTSAASVVILSEAEDVEVEINPNDLRVDVYRSSGPGGQSVNTTDSAVRITHLPSGIVVTCQDEKSQLKNKTKAMKVLKARLYDKAIREQNESITSQRRNMVAGGDRSAKIRTYNFPQGRVTDHRINLTLYKLDKVLEGGIGEFIEKLHLADRDEKLEQFSPLESV
jgi:peptide chain release factor 1